MQRLDLIVIDELGYLPFSQAGARVIDMVEGLRLDPLRDLTGVTLTAA